MNASKLPTENVEESIDEAMYYRDEFLAIASHELKTPLTSLKLQCQLFKRNFKKSDEIYSKEKVERLIEMTDHHVTRLTRLIDDMLDLSRIRCGKLTIQKEAFDLLSLMNDLLSKLALVFKSYGVSTPSLQPEVNLKIFADRGRIEQVLSILLTNAIKYGQGKPLRLYFESTSSVVRIFVVDEGIGIAESLHEKIFDRFSRAVPASEVSGIGLGLFIAKKIIRAHDGNILLESKLGAGSTFIIELPLFEDL